MFLLIENNLLLSPNLKTKKYETFNYKNFLSFFLSFFVSCNEDSIMEDYSASSTSGLQNMDQELEDNALKSSNCVETLEANI